MAKKKVTKKKVAKKSEIDQAFDDLNKAQVEIAKEIAKLMNRFIIYGGHIEMITKRQDGKNGKITVCDSALEALVDEECGMLNIFSKDFLEDF